MGYASFRKMEHRSISRRRVSNRCQIIRIASALQSQRGAVDSSSRVLDDGVLDVLGTGRGELWDSTP